MATTATPTKTAKTAKRALSGTATATTKNDSDSDEDSDEDADSDGSDDGEPDFGELGREPGDDEDDADPTDPEVEVDEESARILKDAIDKTLEQIELNPDLPIRLSDSKKWAQKVFDPASRYGTPRPPNGEERRLVSKLAHDLEALSIPTITKVVRSGLVPPGRLRSREMVRAAAERSQGRMVTARPWETVKRRRTAAPPMVVGLMTDTSGSMAWAQDLVASTAYIIANAAGRVGAKTAAVTFGDYVRPVVFPGQRPTEVRVNRANGASEAFDNAAAALDGILNLSTGNGAKIAVIVSDGHLVNQDEPEKAKMWVDRWIAAGVVVVWVAANQPIFRSDRRIVQVPRVFGSMPASEMIERIGTELKRKVKPR